LRPTWQLVINTGTTIVTFLMVFLIKATQNRDTLALQLKLDELTLATKNASNHIVGIEEASDEEIKKAKVEDSSAPGNPDRTSCSNRSSAAKPVRASRGLDWGSTSPLRSQRPMGAL
jgi:low affinity Fe/Cu permease